LTMEIAVATDNMLGECVLWCERTGRVLWTDILNATLWTHEPASGVTRSFAMVENLASFALTDDDDKLLLGLASGLAWYRFSTGATERIATVEAELPTTRLNDGRCDRQGRFVFGTVNQHGNPRDPIGGFYRVNLDMQVERLPLRHVAIANSICFSIDGATMYYCDSKERTIRCCDYGDALGGEFANDRLFADLRGGPGQPDGSVIDAEGCLWNANWGAGRIVRYRPNGSIERTVAVAAPQPSCIAFAGADLDWLYATTAREDMTDEQVAAAPLSGALFRHRQEVRGLPESRFKGA